MEKPQLVNFIAKIMEESGFKVYKNFKTSQKVVDIYAVLPTQMGDFGVVVACKNYDKEWEVGIDILKEMEMVGRSLKASKVAIVTSSTFSPQARNYASRKNIKLVDRDNLISLAKRYSKKNKESNTNSNHEVEVVDNRDDQYYEDQYYNDYVGEPYEESNPNEFYPDYGDVYDDSYYEEVALANYQPDMYSSSYVNSARASLYKTEQKKEEPKESRFSFLNRSKSNNNQRNSPYPRSPYNSRRNNNERSRPSFNLSSTINSIQEKTSNTNLVPILSNPIVLILLVVIVSYLITYILGVLGGMTSGIIGLIEMIVSLFLSYGLVFLVDRDGATVLIKGSTVFFVSLVILIILIIFI